MNQSSVIFGSLVIGFIVFITLKGELSTYAGLLLLPPQGSGAKTASNQQSSSTVTDVTKGIVQGAILGLGG